MYFDSHAHLDDAHFDGDRAAILDDLKNHGVTMVMNVGCDLPSSERSVRLAEQYPFLYAAVGSHPDDADHVDGALLARYRALCASPRVRAIGEIGLDYHYEDVPRAQQRVAFEKQLSLAEELGLPVIVHEREAHGDAMDILARPSEGLWRLPLLLRFAGNGAVARRARVVHRLYRRCDV